MRSIALNFADWLEVISWRSFWHIFWHSFWHIFWHSFWHIFWHSFWPIFWHSFWHILWNSFWPVFLTYLLIFFLLYLLICFLTYLLIFFLTYRRQNIASTTSHKSHSTNSIFTSNHAAKVIFIRTLYLSNGNSTIAFDCIGQTRQEAIKSQDAMQVSIQPQLHLMACTNHEVRCMLLCLLHLFNVTAPARHSIGLPLIYSNLPKGRQSSKDWSTLLFVIVLPWYATLHKVPSTTSGTINIQSPRCVVLGGSMQMHANVDALSTNPSQRVAPHMPNSFGKATGRPNEDRRRTFPHQLRHGCQTKLTCLHTKFKPAIFAAMRHIK